MICPGQEVMTRMRKRRRRRRPLKRTLWKSTTCLMIRIGLRRAKTRRKSRARRARPASDRSARPRVRASPYATASTRCAYHTSSTTTLPLPRQPTTANCKLQNTNYYNLHLPPPFYLYLSQQASNRQTSSSRRSTTKKEYSLLLYYEVKPS